jgi:hypothetical protein
MSRLQPDAEIIVAETGRKCRVGLIVRDDAGRYWGLTARHVFEGLHEARLKTPDGATIGAYSSKQGASPFETNKAAGQISRFALESSAVAPDRIAAGVTWPRSAIEEAFALGTSLIPTDPSGAVRGTVVAIDSIAQIGAGESSIMIEGATIIELDDSSLLRPGLAGTLFISDIGEAVAIGFAAGGEPNRATIIGSPLPAYLEELKLRLWAPSGAHWSDLPRRARAFLGAVKDDLGPDLGPPPVDGNRA